MQSKNTLAWKQSFDSRYEKDKLRAQIYKVTLVEPIQNLGTIWM